MTHKQGRIKRSLHVSWDISFRSRSLVCQVFLCILHISCRCYPKRRICIHAGGCLGRWNMDGLQLISTMGLYDPVKPEDIYVRTKTNTNIRIYITATYLPYTISTSDAVSNYRRFSVGNPIIVDIRRFFIASYLHNAIFYTGKAKTSWNQDPTSISKFPGRAPTISDTSMLYTHWPRLLHVKFPKSWCGIHGTFVISL